MSRVEDALAKMEEKKDKLRAGIKSLITNCEKRIKENQRIKNDKADVYNKRIIADQAKIKSLQSDLEAIDAPATCSAYTEEKSE